MLALMLAFFQLPSGQDAQFLVETFGTLSNAWANALQPMALKLFWSLAFIDFCWWAFELWREDFDGLLRGLVQRVVVISFWFSFLTHNQEWLHAITDSFAMAGKRAAAAGGMTADISPMGLFHQGLIIFHNIQGSMSGTSLLTNGSVVLVGTMSAVGIMLAFVILLLQFLIAKIEIDVVLGAGVLLLAFGGSRWTRPYAERVIGCAITAGVRIMFIYLLFGASQPLTARWITATQNIPTSQLFEVTISIFASVMVYVALAWFVPSLADRLISGSGGLSASSAIGMAGAAVAGGTAIAGMVASGGTSAALGAGAKAAAGAGGSAASSIGGAAASHMSHAAMGFGGGFSGAGVDAPPPSDLPAPPLTGINTATTQLSQSAGGALDVPAPPPPISMGAQSQSHAAIRPASISSTNTNSGTTLNSSTASSTTAPSIQRPAASASSPVTAPTLHSNQASAELAPAAAAPNSVPVAPSISGAPAPAAPAVTGPASSAARGADTEAATPPQLPVPPQLQTGPDVEKLAQALRSMPETGGHVPAPKLKVDGD